MSKPRLHRSRPAASQPCSNNERRVERPVLLSRMRIGVTVPAPIGHLNAMTALARRLESRGHEVICIGIPDAASGVAAAGLRFEEYCGKQFPLGSYAERAATLSKLSGDAGFAYTLQWIEDGCRAELAETPGVPAAGRAGRTGGGSDSSG